MNLWNPIPRRLIKAVAIGSSIGLLSLAIIAAPKKFSGPRTVDSDDDIIVVGEDGIETEGLIDVIQDGQLKLVTDDDSKIVIKPGFEAYFQGGDTGQFRAYIESDYAAFLQLLGQSSLENYNFVDELKHFEPQASTFFGRGLDFDPISNRIIVQDRHRATINRYENGWIWEAELSTTNSASQVDSLLHKSVAIFGEFAAVAMPSQNGSGPSSTDEGRVDVFHLSDGVWDRVGTIFRPDSNEYAGYGWSIDIYENWLFVGAPFKNQYDSPLTDIGSVYVYTLSSSPPQPVGELSRSGSVTSTNSRGLGWTVAAHGDILAITNYGVDSFEALYIYKLNSGTWEHIQSFTAPINGGFGGRMSISGDWIAVSSSQREFSTLSNVGEVSLYKRTTNPDPTLFEEQTSTLTPWNPTEDLLYGSDVSLFGDVLAILAGNTQYAYIYRLDTTSDAWELESTMQSSTVGQPFQNQIAVGREFVAIASENVSGLVYTYALNSPPEAPADLPPVLPYPPASPSSLDTFPDSVDPTISLTWNDNATNEDGFTVHRREGTGAYTQIASLPPNTEGYEDNGLEYSTSYTYRVFAYNSNGTSASKERSGLTVDAPAQNNAPTAIIITSPNPASGTAPLTVNFDASNSSDSDLSDTLTYTWDFEDDGTPDASDTFANHTYTNSGSYTARLTVTDNGSPPLNDQTTVTINVSQGNPTPNPSNDSFEIFEDDDSFTLNVLINDQPDDGSLSIQSITSGQYGTVSDQGDGNLQYILDNTHNDVQSLSDNQTRPDSFTYTVTDGVTPVQATVNVTIKGINDQPVASDLTTPGYQIDKDNTDGVEIVFEAEDAEDGSIPIGENNVGVIQPSYGQVLWDENDPSGARWEYVPIAGFVGSDTFEYHVFDSKGLPSANENVSVEVTLDPNTTLVNLTDSSTDRMTGPATGSDQYFGIGVDIDHVNGRMITRDHDKAYIYQHNSGTSWSLIDTLDPTVDVPTQPDDDIEIIYGRDKHTVAIDGDYAAVSGPIANIGGQSAEGVVYVYIRDGNNWNKLARLESPFPNQQSRFGQSIAIHQNRLVVGAVGIESSDPFDNRVGKAFVYNLSPAGVSSPTTIERDLFQGLDKGFGASVDIFEDVIAVGVAHHSPTAPERVIIFEYDSGSWVYRNAFSNPEGIVTLFGTDVSLSGNVLAVGSAQSNNEDGAVYMYRYDETASEINFTFWQRIDPWNSSDEMGNSVSLNGDTLLVGPNTGSYAYLYRLHQQSDRWNLDTTFTSLETHGKTFAFDVALGTNQVIITKEIDQIGVYDKRGSIYKYEISPPATPPDEIVEFSIEQVVDVNESDGTALVSVTKVGNTSQQVSVSYNFASGGGSAMAIGTQNQNSLGADYYITPSTERVLTWESGDTATFKDIQVTIIDDAEPEVEESFLVKLSSTTGDAVIAAQDTAVVRIGQNDNYIAPSFTVHDVTVTEPSSGEIDIEYSVTLNGTRDLISRVRARPSEGTAESPEDYTAGAFSTLIWTANTPATQTRTVKIYADNDDTEGNEVFYVDLENPEGATIADGHAIITIQDNSGSGSAPAAPSSLTVETVTTDSISLSWTRNSTNEEQFRVERGTDGNTFPDTFIVGAGATTYLDANLLSGAQYYYRVRAENASGESGYSNIVNYTTLIPTSGNAAPTASFTATPRSVPNTLTVDFNASNSDDPDGEIVSYAWDFGDGNNGTGVTPNHTYAAAGNYTVELTVTDDGSPSKSGTHSIGVTVTETGGPGDGTGGGSPGSGDDFGDPSDDDGDGMPAGWESNFGLNPSDGSALDDHDADGVSDYFEYKYDTDPTDSASKPGAGVYRVGSGQPYLTIQAALNQAMGDSVSDVIVELFGDTFTGTANTRLDLGSLAGESILLIADDGLSDTTIDLSGVQIIEGLELTPPPGRKAPIILQNKQLILIQQFDY